MEQKTQTQQTLDKLRLQIEYSPVLPIVLPLFETLNYQDEYYPNRVTEHNGDAQLLWEAGKTQSGNFERLCLTLSRRTLNLTIALDHRHENNSFEIPVITHSNFDTPLRATMVIDGHTQTHSLYETNRNNGVLSSIYYENEAINHFTPKLIHSLATLSLYGYEQDEQQEVS